MGAETEDETTVYTGAEETEGAEDEAGNIEVEEVEGAGDEAGNTEAEEVDGAGDEAEKEDEKTVDTDAEETEGAKDETEAADEGTENTEAEEAGGAGDEAEPEQPKKTRQCQTTYKKMSRRCLKEEWEERQCGNEDGASNPSRNSCADLSKRCQKEGKNKACCKAIFCWGRKSREDFPL